MNKSTDHHFSLYSQATCRFHGSVKGCKYSNNCNYSQVFPQSIPLCHNIVQFNTCRFGDQCKFRHHVPDNLSNVNHELHNHCAQPPHQNLIFSKPKFY